MFDEMDNHNYWWQQIIEQVVYTNNKSFHSNYNFKYTAYIHIFIWSPIRCGQVLNCDRIKRRNANQICQRMQWFRKRFFLAVWNFSVHFSNECANSEHSRRISDTEHSKSQLFSERISVNTISRKFYLIS